MEKNGGEEGMEILQREATNDATMRTGFVLVRTPTVIQKKEDQPLPPTKRIPAIAPPVIQREILNEDEGLKEIKVSDATEARVVHFDEDGVFEILVKGIPYILKMSSEGVDSEVAGTLIAGMLGASVAKISKYDLTLGDIEILKKVTVKNEDSSEALDALNAGQTGILMERLPGTDLDKLKGKEATGVTGAENFDRNKFLNQLGELLAVDILVGIGDRFKPPAISQGEINPGNIVYDKGKLHGIDYDISQGDLFRDKSHKKIKSEEKIRKLERSRIQFRNEAVKLLTNPAELVIVIKKSMSELAPDIKDEQQGDDNAIIEGINKIVLKLKDIDPIQLEQLKNEANTRIEGFGDHISTLIKRIIDPNQVEEIIQEVGNDKNKKNDFDWFEDF